MEKTKRITIYDVAKEANVSVSTVSRVVNNTHKVSDDIRFAVEKAVVKLGYIPSSLAIALSRKTTSNVGIVLPSPNYSYISSIMSGMLDVCKLYGFTPTLFTYEDPEDSHDVVDKVISSQMEGIVIFNSELSASDLHKMVRLRIPMVLIGRDNLGNNCLVDMNYSSSLKQTIERFLKRGLKDIYYLKDPLKDWHMISTFEESIKEAINVEGKGTYHEVSINDSYKSIYDYYYDKFEKEKPNHELYVTLRDSLGSAIINAALDRGYHVPNDLEVISIVGTKQSLMSRPCISSIDVDLYEVGSYSMRLLTKMLNNRTHESVYKFTTKYVKRDSTLD